MFKFWALFAIAAFYLEGVVSIDFGIGQPGGANPFGRYNVPRLDSGKEVPTPSIPLPHFGDDKIRIARIAYLSIEFFSRSFHLGV